MIDISKKLSNCISQSIDVKNKLLKSKSFNKDFIKIVNAVTDTLKKDGKIITCGNGGSASDAQHMTSEFMVRLRKNFKRPPIPCITLANDSPLFTAHSNDLNFNSIFSRSIEALGKKNDCLIVFSTSGKSKNIIEILKAARNLKITSVGFLGNNGGEAHNFCDYSLIIPSNKTSHIQEAHITLVHILVEIVEEILHKK